MTGTFGPKHESAFGYWDANTSFLRTYQASFSLETEDCSLTASKFWGTFPNWGLMQDGEFIAQPMPVPATCAAAGLSWPTPRAGKTTSEKEESWMARYEDGKVATPPLGLAVKMWPTPSASPSGFYAESEETTSNRPNSDRFMTLPRAVKMHRIPTPTTADVYTGNMKSSQQSEGSMHSVSLPDYVAQRWATPNARNYRDTGKNIDYHKLAKKSKLGGQAVIQDQNTEASLNPDWVERYLMSLPEGWTMLEPLPDGAYDQWWQGMKDGTWWAVDPGDIPEADGGIPRTVEGAVDRKKRLQMLGNGIVPASAALAIKDMSTW